MRTVIQVSVHNSLQKARENTLRRIRRSMHLLYDTNALELGFVSDGAWLKWET
jgi:hypothetical protein